MKINDYNAHLNRDLELIKQVVLKAANEKEFYANSRKRNYVVMRDVYYKLAREFTLKPFSIIADSLDKDHATVIHSIRKTKFLIKYDQLLQDLYARSKVDVMRLFTKDEYIEDEKVIIANMNIAKSYYRNLEMKLREIQNEPANSKQ